ncbi:MAG: hypothetical protein V1819_02620 [bacterium]
MFKYGIKIWNINKDWFGQVVELIKRGQADFVEIYLVPDSFALADFNIFLENKIPVVIHAPHTTHDFDVFNLTKESLDIWHNQVIKTADYLKSQFIITHAGVGSDENIFKRESLKLKDKRVLMENLPHKGFIDLGGVFCFGYSKKQLLFVKSLGFDFCFDVCHAVASACSQKINPYDFIGECIDLLKPRYFHLAGGNVADDTDKHLDLWQGTFDYKFIKEKLAPLAQEEDVCLSFEVPKKGNGLENDLENINYFKSL